MSDQPRQKRHRHEKDHDRAVRRENLVEMVGRQITLIAKGDGLLAPHHGGIDKAAHQHDKRQHHVHDADFLVIEARDPVEQHDAPSAKVRNDGDH